MDRKTRNTKPRRPNNPFVLNVGVVSNRSESLGGSALDNVALTRLGGLTLQVQVDTLLAGLALLLSVLRDTADEVLARAGVLDVFDADVDALLNVAVVDNLVEEDTDGRLGDIVNNTSLSVEDLVRHTALDGTIDVDIDNVPDPRKIVRSCLFIFDFSRNQATDKDSYR